MSMRNIVIPPTQIVLCLPETSCIPHKHSTEYNYISHEYIVLFARIIILSNSEIIRTAGNTIVMFLRIIIMCITDI